MVTPGLARRFAGRSFPVNKLVKNRLFPHTRNEAKVVRALFAGYVSTKAVGYHSRIHIRTIQRILVRMEALGLVQNDTHHSGDGRHTLWLPLIEVMWNAGAFKRAESVLRRRN